MIDRTLGHYRIVEKLGAGGMGEVYRAEDTNLSRHVAIKVLPEVFSRDFERLARFEREAKLLASLNHPNIAAIYGLEEADGQRFLVLELVEGETLAEWLSRGPLPMEMALGVCLQIAEGVEAAHEKGVIHRDLKPANIKITPEGKVKILDFGLAKAYQKEGSAPDLSKSPTLTDEMTGAGVILGTAAYMSPEQATGKPIDKRTDIWAFGCVLFECLTGRQAFEGKTVAEILAAILRGEPDWQVLPAATPWRVKDLLHRCLRKDPKERLHDIADARIELQEQMALPKEPLPVSQRLPLAWLIATGVTALLVGVLIGPAVMKYFKPATSQISQPVVRSSVRLEPGHWLEGWRLSPPYGFDHPTRTAMAISSDGHFIVYSAVKENPGSQDEPRLYLRRLDRLEAKPLAGTEGGIDPFLSPDDRWVGFWANGKLMKISVEGGIPATLCDVSHPFGINWGSDNQIVFARHKSSGLSRVSADGGKPEVVTIPDKSKEEYSHRLPHCLPAGKGILFTIKRHAWDHEPRVAVLELGTRKWHVLLEDAADARYVATGHLAFLRRGTLMVVPFDPDKLQVTGQAVPALAKVSQALNTTNSGLDTGAGQFCISTSGSLVYASGGIVPDQENTLVWVDYRGKAEPIASFKAPFYAPRLSPDGQRIAYSRLGMESHIWVYDLNRATATKLTSEGMSQFAAWTPDGRRMVFDWVNTGVPNIYWQAVDGSSSMERLTQGEYHHWPGSWSPDGETLAFVQDHPDSGVDILFLSMRDRRITPFLNSPFNEEYPEFSPDGRWIAYGSDESGRLEVYVQPFPGPGGKWQISNEGGAEPLWSRNGKQLFYRQPYYRRENQVFVVDVQTGSGFSATKPRLLFEQSGYSGMAPIRTWDISPDGQRFLMVKQEERKPQPVTELILVQNWFEELKRLAPTGKK
jgi:serine/threonine protein kinase/Tol biopolymer transport system component